MIKRLLLFLFVICLHSCTEEDSLPPDLLVVWDLVEYSYEAIITSSGQDLFETKKYIGEGFNLDTQLLLGSSNSWIIMGTYSLSITVDEDPPTIFEYQNNKVGQFSYSKPILTFTDNEGTVYTTNIKDQRGDFLEFHLDNKSRGQSQGITVTETLQGRAKFKKAR